MATASAGRARQGFVAGSRAFRAPLQHDRLAVGGQGRGEEKPKARQPSSCAQTRGAIMSDPEIEELRNKVHCAVVLERTPPPWKLDRKESTKLSLKYRRGKGEILIVSHGGKGWWDPTSDAKGDVFGLVQRLEPGANFGHVRKRLREFAGLKPSFPIAERAGRRKASDRSVAERWADRKAVWPDSPTWRYLARKRFLPSAIIEAASAAGVLREGPAGSAWFAHFIGAGSVAHVDIRGPTYKGSLTGGAKSLFCYACKQCASPSAHSHRGRDRRSERRRHRESSRRYALRGKRRGHGTGHDRGARSAGRTHSNAPRRSVLQRHGRERAGDRFAERHRSLAEKFSVPFARLRPPIEGGDWNDVLRARSQHQGSTP